MESQFNSYTNPSENDRSNFQPIQKPINVFATFSWMFATAAIFTSLFFYASYILGALAIVFALLSRGGQMKFCKKAKVGLFLGVFAILFTTILTIGGLYLVIEEFGSIENMLREYCNMYNLDFEELYGNIF